MKGRNAIALTCTDVFVCLVAARHLLRSRTALAFEGRAGPLQWTAASAALVYLMGYIKLHLLFKLLYKRGRKGVDFLDGFAESNWNTQLSQLCTIALFNKAPISWKSKSSALSTSEAEYIAVSAAAAEMIYLCRLCKILNFPMKHQTPIGEDNSGCIEWTNYVIEGRERTKHIDLCKHFAHDAVQNGEIILYRVSSQDQLSDFLTKPLSEARSRSSTTALEIL